MTEQVSTETTLEFVPQRGDFVTVQRDGHATFHCKVESVDVSERTARIVRVNGNQEEYWISEVHPLDDDMREQVHLTYAFASAHDQVREQLHAVQEQLRTTIQEHNDWKERVQQRLWEVADKPPNGASPWCEDFDREMERWGLQGRPPQEREWMVNIAVEPFTVQVAVTATDEDSAMELVEQSAVDEAIVRYVRYHSADWSAEDADEA